MNWQAMQKDMIRRSRELFKISAPLAIEQVCVMFMGVVSTAMVSSVGEYAISAVGMIDSISALIISLLSALATGGTIVVAQFIGMGQRLKAKQASGQSVILSLGFALIIFSLFLFLRKPIVLGLFGDTEPEVIEAGLRFLMIVNFSFPILAVTQTISGVMRGSGDTGTPMIISIIMNVINIAIGFPLIKGLDFWFIHIPSFGVTGAAIALVAARFVGMCIGIYLIVFRSKTMRMNQWRYFKPDFSIQKTVLNLGIPTGVESSLFQVGKLITQVYIVAMGTAAIAANTIGGSILGFINVPGNAFALGTMILVGQKIGRGEPEDVSKSGAFAIGMGSLFFLALCVICFIFTDQIIAIYQPSPLAGAHLRQMLHAGFIATPLFWGISFITPAVLRATGDVKYTMVVAIISMFAVRIVLGYVLGVMLHMNVLGVWMGMFADWIIRGAFFIWRLASGKWRQKGIKME